MRWIGMGFGVLLLAFGFFALLRMRFYPRISYGMHMMGLGGGLMMVFGFILLCLFMGIVFRLIFRGPRSDQMSYWRNRSSEAEEILRVRYAKGEITKEQYDQTLRDLREGRNI
jgi:putative membrane protein